MEIHNPGNPGGSGAYFKWSRENASVQTTVLSVSTGKTAANTDASVLTVASLGRDQVLGFAAGNWIEITNDTNDKLCQPGTLYQIDHVDPSSTAITLTTKLAALPSPTDAYTRVIRWDQSGKIYKGDNTTLIVDLDALNASSIANGVAGIPVPTDGSSVYLENGIIVTFSKMPGAGSFLPMDYWNFSARSSTGLLDPLIDAPPRGQHHHRTALSVVSISATGTVTNTSDCRPKTSSGSGQCGCCSVSVGTGGQYSTIKDAVNALPQRGGEIQLLSGNLFEDVILDGKHDIVIHGCGWQTQVFSASLGSGTGTGGSNPAPVSNTGFPAVFTIVDCTNIELRDFSIRADEGAIGVLLDRTPDTRKSPPPNAQGFSEEVVVVGTGKPDINIILKELIVEATTLPSIVAVTVTALKILSCRVFMKDVRSLWAGVYLSGTNIYFRHNWVGIGAAKEFTFIPPQPPTTPSADTNNPTLISDAVVADLTYAAQLAPGGIHIAGPSQNIFIVENEIAGGIRNGITLGNFILLDALGYDTGKLTGVQAELDSECSTGGSSLLPPSTGTGTKIQKIVSGGPIQNLNIDRNSIHNTGMAGIGMVGFWDLREVTEVIGIVGLGITGNILTGTMSRAMAPIDNLFSGFAAGAITLADVEDLIIRDNLIINFGESPIAEVCGIYILHAQSTEISRNRILETRDWSSDATLTVRSASTRRAGIFVYLATPPTLDATGWNLTAANNKLTAATLKEFQAPLTPVYQQGLPALRIENNVVRVAFDLALRAFGLGPFSIVNNQLSSGGIVSLSAKRKYTSDDLKAAAGEFSRYTNPMLVEILNLGLALEHIRETNRFADDYTLSISDTLAGDQLFANTGTGAVMFANNNCQLEAWLSGLRGSCAVQIFTADDLLFTGNHLWLDAPPSTALCDAILIAMTLQMSSNRLQESRYFPVKASGLSVGRANITANNIATYCLYVEAPNAWKVDSNNVILAI